MTDQRTAFTLVELIVAIAVIAVLAAIIFPTMAAAKTAAKRTVSLNNIKQIGVALDLYSQDNDGYFPHAVYYWGALSFIENTPGTVCKKLRTSVTFDVALRDYTRNEDIFFSPFHRPPRIGKYGLTRSSYLYNCSFPFYRAQVQSLRDPSITTLLTDEGESVPGFDGQRPALCLMADRHARYTTRNYCMAQIGESMFE